MACTLAGRSPTFSTQLSPCSPSCTTTTLRCMSQVSVQPVRRVSWCLVTSVDDEGAGKQTRKRSTSLGKVSVIIALLMQFRAKMFPKLPATTNGICFASSAVAARSLSVIFYHLRSIFRIVKLCFRSNLMQRTTLGTWWLPAALRKRK